MKVAVQLYGHLRTFELCYKKLYECLINFCRCDVFIHTWDTPDHTTQTWHNFRMSGSYDPEEIKSKVVAYYHPKKYIVEKQETREEGCVIAQHKPISIYGIKAMLYSMQQVNKLREEYEGETGQLYDYVVMLRPDVELLLPLELPLYIDNTDMTETQNSFYFGGSYKYKHILNNWRAIGGSDVLFFAPRLVMSKIYANIDELIRNCTDQEIACYGPEYAFLYTIEKMGIHLQFINYLLGEKFTILRAKPTGKRKRWYSRIIRIHIRKCKLEFGILAMLPFNVVEVELHLHTLFKVYFSIGKMAN